MVAFKIHVFDESLFEGKTNRSIPEIWKSFLSLMFSPMIFKVCPRVSCFYLNNLDNEVKWIEVSMPSPLQHTGLKVS